MAGAEEKTCAKRHYHVPTGYTKLVQDCLKRFDHVRQIVLLTDDEEKQAAFYKKLGLTNTKEVFEGRLNTFVRYKY